MAVRIENGIPRGGLGYLGLIPAAISIVCAFYLAVLFASVISVSCTVLCLWLGWGLRRDGDAGEKIDLVVIHDRENWFEFEWSIRDSLFRVSSLVMAGGAAGLTISIARFFGGW